MATVLPVSQAIAPGVIRTLWEALASGSTALAEGAAAGMVRQTVQIEGTFGTGTIVMEGSNASTVTGPYVTLPNEIGDVISATGDTLWMIQGTYRWVRPRVSVAVGSMDVNVHMVSTADR